MMTCAITESPLLGGGAPLPHKPSSKGDFDFGVESLDASRQQVLGKEFIACCLDNFHPNP
jgi:hypothetical protein